MKTALRLLLVLAGVGLPALAWANVGIGFLIPAIPVAVIALPVAILVEAPIIAWLMGVAFKRALYLSLCANVVSTLLGGAIFVALDVVLIVASGSAGGEPVRAAVLVALVPLFFVTWWIERWVVRRMQKGDARATRATFAANVVSYVLMAAAVALVVPARGNFIVRSQLTEVLMAMSAAKTGLAEKYAATGRMPATLEDVPTLQFLKSLVVDPQGRLVATLSMPDRADVDNRHIVMAPRIEGGKIVEWRCSSPDLPPRYLPASCR